ncbi:MAG TPA: hypothetical protein PLA94_27745 [Myxococcota bacterium]|nr:hypothetical protein [Myxococcota bacterium]
MLALADRLSDLGEHPRAIAWKIRFLSGMSSSAPVRSFAIFAPATAEAGKLVLLRLHNGVLLHNPAAVELEAPIPADRLEPGLGAIRSIHKVGIHLAGEAPVETASVYDLPAVDRPEVVSASGPAAGLDIGGTTIKGCILLDGKLAGTASIPTWPEGERGIGSLVHRCRRLLEDLSDQVGQKPGSLGIGLASPMGVGGRVLELSTVMRERVGSTEAFEGFAGRVAEGLVEGPVAIFNDLSNLGRHLSAQGARRVVRLQIGTSFGGCWIDSDGMVWATEMGRLVVDVGPDAVPHTYLPIAGAMRTYLSNTGLARFLGEAGQTVDPRTSGHHLKALLDLGHPAGMQALLRMADALRGVVRELHALLPGITRVEVGGSMLAGPAGKSLLELMGDTPVEFGIARQPAHDGAIAAALAPRVDAQLKGMRRVGG